MAEYSVRGSDVKIVQFSTTEKGALDWAAEWAWLPTASAEHNIRTLISKLNGPHKLTPFEFESEGAKLRGIKASIHESIDYMPWRQELVDTLVLYRQHFPGWNAAGGNVVFVNFHALDPNVFPDMFVPEGRAARNFRFLVQRHLFGVAMNTSLEDIDGHAFTDWEFSGEPPFVETVPSGVWTTAAHATGFCNNTFHGYMSVSYTHLTLPTKRIV